MRVNLKFIYIGTTGTGKTSYIKNNIDYFNLPKVLIADCAENPEWQTMETFDNPEWASRKIPIMPLEKLPHHKKGIYHIFHEDTELLEELIFQHVNNCVLIWEDATQWFGATLNKFQKKIILRGKQVNVDHHMIFHSSTDVPKRLIGYCDFIVLFKTNESTFDKSKYTNPQFEKCFNEVRDSKDPFIHRIIRLK